jgi:type IV pilus assembly protein PilQ
MERDEMIQAEKSRRDLQPLAVLTLPLNYSDAANMEGQVSTVLTERGEMSIDERTNTLIVRDTEEGLAKARALVRAIDTPTPQVLIEARIVEASQSFTRSLGIQWGGYFNFSFATG